MREFLPPVRPPSPLWARSSGMVCFDHYTTSASLTLFPSCCRHTHEHPVIHFLTLHLHKMSRPRMHLPRSRLLVIPPPYHHPPWPPSRLGLPRPRRHHSLVASHHGQQHSPSLLGIFRKAKRSILTQRSGRRSVLASRAPGSRTSSHGRRGSATDHPCLSSAMTGAEPSARHPTPNHRRLMQ